MGYILDSEIHLKRAMVFLCGPYFEDSNKSDRRSILKDFLIDNYSHNIIPLIIDDFLTKENIDDPSINVQLLEEIFAAVSGKTYIFLDTISTAAELGLFTNSSFQHKVQVFLPKESDILEKSNVGYFVREIMLKHNHDRVDFLYYRPKIIRSPIASDYVREHYGFINDALPPDIQNSILSDPIYNTAPVQLTVVRSNTFPEGMASVNYDERSHKLFVKVSIRLLFYVAVAIVYKNYRRDITSKCKIGFSKDESDRVKEIITRTFITTIKSAEFINLGHITEIQIETKLNHNFSQIIDHMLEFIIVYHQYNPRGRQIIENEKGILKRVYNSVDSKNPIEFFRLNENNLAVILASISTPEQYYESFSITRKRKKRHFTKYNGGEDGSKIRAIHKSILHAIETNYQFTKYSYAYRKHASIRSCTMCHIESDSFIKMDIRNFFKSIKIKNVVPKVQKHLNLEKSELNNLKTILTSCFVNNELPLGLVLSPVISDIYLHDFDENLGTALSEIDSEIVYTRYADDLLISRGVPFSSDERDLIISKVKSLLRNENLLTNENKTIYSNLRQQGDHFKYLGVNIVKGTTANFLSVGKSYIYGVAKDYFKYLQLPTTSIEERTHKFYFGKQIAGKVGFIKQIEGPHGFELLTRRIKKTDDSVSIPEDRLLIE